MTIFINTGNLSGYTDLALDEALKALNDGAPIRVWWFDSHGDRNEEVVVFTEFNYVRTADNG